MLYRTIGETGVFVSILGFGCMRLPKNDDNSIDEKLAREMIYYAIDHGVNYFDTAWSYHRGESEKFVGKVLENGYREQVHLATKLPSWLIKEKKDLDYYLNEQLKRLRTDHIDFYLLHTLGKKHWKTLKEVDVFEFIERNMKNGKIRHIGFSFHDSVDVFKQIIDEYDWEFCQIQYNYIDLEYQAGREGLFYAANKNIGTIIMEPLRGGRLTENIPDEIKEIWNEVNPSRSSAEWALRWLWNHPEINTVLSGMSKLDQVKENIKIAEEGFQNSLSQEELSAINRSKEIYKSRLKVNCTLCGYCLPCPEEVNIPQCFRHYNNAYMFDSHDWAKRMYNMFLKDDHKASNCIECGECEEKCPQNIKIRENLKHVVDLFEG